MADYVDFTSLLNSYNFTGAVNTFTVPNILLNLDAQQNYIVTYSYFRNYSDITSSGYYDANDVEPQYIVDGTEYRQDIENAIQSILNPVDQYSVLFSDVAKINFQEDAVSTGIITFSQMNGTFPVFGNSAVSAGAYIYTPSAQNPTERYGDIWINRDQDSTEGATFNSYNIWDNSGNIDQTTLAYKVLLEEISHSLGIDIYDTMGVARNSDLDSHKYTITSYNVHPDMEYDTTTFLGFPEDRNVINASGNPFPKGLQLFDIAAFQEIYGSRNYETPIISMS